MPSSRGPSQPRHLVTKKVCVGGGLVACSSEASKQARLVERQVCFISDAGNKAGRVADICPKADFRPHHNTQGVRAFTDRAGRWGYMQKQHSHL